MADYYPLVAKAIAGLEKNTGEGRRALYERARTALVAQLRGMNDPPLTEAEITRERLALEEAIRKVEAEAARRGALRCRRGPSRARARGCAARSRRAAGAARMPRDRARPRRRAATPPTERPGTQPRNRSGGERRSVTDEGLKGFRDVIAEAEALGDATAQGAKTAREVFAATPPTTSQTFDRLEPRVEPEGLRTPSARRAAAAGAAACPSRACRQPAYREPRVTEPDAPPWAAREPPRGARLSGAIETRGSAAAAEPAAPAFGRRHRRAAEALARRAGGGDPDVLIILGLGAAAYWQRDRIAALVNVVRGPAKQAQKDAQPSRPKIPDRVGQPAVRTGCRAADRRSRAPARSRRSRSASCSTRRTRPTRRASATSGRRSGAPRP